MWLVCSMKQEKSESMIPLRGTYLQTPDGVPQLVVSPQVSRFEAALRQIAELHQIILLQQRNPLNYFLIIQKPFVTELYVQFVRMKKLQSDIYGICSCRDRTF